MENVVILGSGCAGLTAAIYTARADLKPIVISGKESGGQLMLTTEVENFPGFPEGIQGPQLIDNMKKQAERFGTVFKLGDAIGFDKKEDHYEIQLKDETILTKTVIIATGASTMWLGLESENKYRSKGISACATCDAFFFKDKEVIVIGGGDSAAEEAIFLTKFATKVYIIHRRDQLRASKIMQERILNHDKIEMIWNSEVTEFLGDEQKLTGVKLKNNQTNEEKDMPINGVFLAIGHKPNTKIFKDKIELDEKGFIKTDRLTKTNMEGVFACGDVQDPVFKQAVTSAGKGCEAAIMAERYLLEESK